MGPEDRWGCGGTLSGGNQSVVNGWRRVTTARVRRKWWREEKKQQRGHGQLFSDGKHALMIATSCWVCCHVSSCTVMRGLEILTPPCVTSVEPPLTLHLSSEAETLQADFLPKLLLNSSSSKKKTRRGIIALQLSYCGFFDSSSVQCEIEGPMCGGFIPHFQTLNLDFINLLLNMHLNSRRSPKETCSPTLQFHFLLLHHVQILSHSLEFESRSKLGSHGHPSSEP